MKALGKITLTLGLMIIVSLFLTSCNGVVTPEISMENPNNPSSNIYQSPSTDPVDEQATEDTEDPKTEEPQKWPGLGMGLYYYLESYVDTLLANGFEYLRIDIPNYQDTEELYYSKAKLPGIIAKGAKIIWGVTSNPGDDEDYTITAKNWPTFRLAILDAAQWAQDNGVYEFQLGNEEESHVDGTTMTVDQIITNLKSIATEVKEIFTNGEISYSCNFVSKWISAGKGDIDILAANIYRGGNGVYNDSWKTDITNLVNAFGAGGTYITEFNLSYSSLDDYSADEAVQAKAVTEMIEYIKASGMTRALFYFWKSDAYGVVKGDETYRLLWKQALLNTEPVKFATVSTTTTTISAPDTIVLMPRITPG